MLKFDEKNHKYTHEGVEFISTTQFLEQFKVPFDKERWSTYVANRDSKTQQEVLDMWARNAKKARAFGTIIHNYADEVIKNKSNQLDSVHMRKGKLATIMNHVDSAIEMLDLKTIKHSEVMVWNKELRLAGTIDVVKQTQGGIAILDWKTNKEIKLANRYQNMLHPLTEFHDCNYNHYLFQLNMYRFLYEHTFNEKVTSLGIIHLSEQGYELIDCPILDDEIQELIKIRLNQIKD
ncbi:MAG: PD-(D/E)XK nuclease family protein [Nanoarchaeota archaeon]|nr:PD-(D/E)XK nuclease family protein [Nanoarchaeota archaeon]